MPEAVGMEVGKEPKSNQADALQDIIFLHQNYPDQNYPDNEWLRLTNQQRSLYYSLRIKSEAAKRPESGQNQRLPIGHLRRSTQRTKTRG